MAFRMLQRCLIYGFSLLRGKFKEEINHVSSVTFTTLLDRQPLLGPLDIFLGILPLLHQGPKGNACLPYLLSTLPV